MRNLPVPPPPCVCVGLFQVLRFPHPPSNSKLHVGEYGNVSEFECMCVLFLWSTGDTSWLYLAFCPLNAEMGSGPLWPCTNAVSRINGWVDFFRQTSNSTLRPVKRFDRWKEAMRAAHLDHIGFVPLQHLDGLGCLWIDNEDAGVTSLSNQSLPTPGRKSERREGEETEPQLKRKLTDEASVRELKVLSTAE